MRCVLDVALLLQRFRLCLVHRRRHLLVRELFYDA